jgi:MscS family membrane protein
VLFVQNFTGIDISAFLIHLGVIGLALALAARETLANLFGAFTILFDKPFEIGDEIVVEDHDGVVESVGFRSTRIRTLTGRLVVIPNNQLVTSSLRNITQRPYLRWHTNIGISCDSTSERAARAVEILREVFTDNEDRPDYRPPQIYFNGFNESSLNIAVYAWCYRRSWWDWQAWREEKCLEILRRFTEEGIEMPYPTQKLLFSSETDTPIKVDVVSS